MKKVLILITVVAIAIWAYTRFSGEPAHPHLRDATTLTRIDSGEIVGFIDQLGSRAWQGIPFAAAPVGAQRWRAPQPPSAWKATREALQPGSLCPQFASLLSGAEDAPSGSITGSEDCLYLNVWAPSDATDTTKAPVMLWLHGGGNSIGHGGSYSGDHLSSAEGVVVVTINYRLGPFGWFAHPALARGDALDDSGNYGSLDAIRALEWTRDNIAAFGGDANNVTLFGESAGAADTLAMLASPLARGLFHRAIVQSGGFRTATLAQAQNFIDNIDPGHAFSGREVVNQLLVHDGLASDRDTARTQQDDMASSEIRDYLYAKSAEDILSVYSGGSFGMINFVQLIADGHVLPNGDAAAVFASTESYNAVPIILGTNRDEAALFMARSPEYVDNRLGFLPKLKDEVAYLADVRYASLAWKARGVDDLARLMTKVQPGSVYAYRFDWDEEPSVMGYDLSKALGAAHGLEIAFAFGSFDGGLGLSYLYPETPARDQLARSMMGYWANFARGGDPARGTSGNEPQWLAWGTDGQRMIVLDSANDGGIKMTHEEVSVPQIKLALASDTTIASPRARCRLYARMFAGGQYWNAAEYQALGSEGCGEFPAEDFAF